MSSSTDTTMTLLGLPTEIFQNVVHYLVADAGVDEAWKLRGVCRSFAREITHSIVAKQPNEVVSSGWEVGSETSSKTMDSQLGLYLFYRIKTNYGFPPGPVETFLQMVDYLTDTLQLDPEDKDETLMKLCEHIVDYFDVKHYGREELRDLLWRYGDLQASTFPLLAAISPGHKLNAAVLFRAYDLVQELLPDCLVACVHDARDRFWINVACVHDARDRLWINPIAHAINTQDVKLFCIVLECVASLLGSKSVDIAADILDLSFRAQHSPSPVFFFVTVDFYIDNETNMCDFTYRIFFENAFRIDKQESDVRATSKILEARRHLGYESPPLDEQMWLTAFRLGSLESVKLVIEHSRDVINDIGFYNGESILYDASSILAIAIAISETSDTSIVQALIAAGANVNHAAPRDLFWKEECFPLQLAIQFRDINMVRVLVDAGSNIPPENTWDYLPDLRWAVWNRRDELAEWNRRDEMGRTIEIPSGPEVLEQIFEFLRESLSSRAQCPAKQSVYFAHDETSLPASLSDDNDSDWDYMDEGEEVEEEEEEEDEEGEEDDDPDDDDYDEGETKEGRKGGHGEMGAGEVKNLMAAGSTERSHDG